MIDNTLPSPKLLNPLETLRNIKIEKVVIESGTKHYQEGENEITLGLAYSDNIEKMRAIKSRRIELGTYLQPADERKIPDTITETMPEIMKNHAYNALKIAEVLSDIKGFEVSHPNLPAHKQNDLATIIAPEGVTTLFYITVPPQITGETFMEEVKKLGGDNIGLGSSFGHKKTWLSNYGLDNRTVRIAAGSEGREQFKKILEIFRRVGIQLSR